MHIGNAILAICGLEKRMKERTLVLDLGCSGLLGMGKLHETIWDGLGWDGMDTLDGVTIVGVYVCFVGLLGSIDGQAYYYLYTH